MHEVGAIARYTNRAVLAKGVAAQRRGAPERPGEIVQATVFLVGAGDVKSPFASEVRQEANLPIVATVPKAIDLISLVSGRSEDGLELRILYRLSYVLRLTNSPWKRVHLGRSGSVSCADAIAAARHRPNRINREAILPAKESFGVKPML